MSGRPRPGMGTIAFLGLLAGCAYYNGLYNANRLADDAVKAEREGRPGEAQSLWAQAAVKAESVVVRYPKSKHRDDAWLLQGQALQASGRCRPALDPLERAADSSADVSLREEARLAIGICMLQLGRPDSAIQVLSPLAAGPESAVTGRARLWRGRSYLAVEDADRAIEDLEASGLPDAAFSLSIAYARAGRPALAAETLQRQMDGAYREAAWLPTLDTLGQLDPEISADLVDRLVAWGKPTTAQRARLLLADGRRWSSLHRHARAAQRYADAARSAPDSLVGRSARFEQLLAELRVTRDLAALGSLGDSLLLLPRGDADAARAAERARRVLQRAVRSLRQDTTRGLAVEMFVAAERLRDSLQARPLAGALFVELQRRYPTSLIAPKALLAAAALDSGEAGPLLMRLRTDYPESAYTLALQGLGAALFAATEDSLATLLRLAGFDAERGEQLERLNRETEEAGQRRPVNRRPLR